MKKTSLDVVSRPWRVAPSIIDDASTIPIESQDWSSASHGDWVRITASWLGWGALTQGQRDPRRASPVAQGTCPARAAEDPGGTLAQL
jgi:hypothetical protein